jgi:hypothetical protein
MRTKRNLDKKCDSRQPEAHSPNKRTYFSRIMDQECKLISARPDSRVNKLVCSVTLNGFVDLISPNNVTNNNSELCSSIQLGFALFAHTERNVICCVRNRRNMAEPTSRMPQIM